MYVRIEENELDELTRQAIRLPGLFVRARASALKSVGWMLRREVQTHIRTNGSGQWPRPHPLTLRFGHGFGGAPKRRRRRKTYVPYRWMTKLVRYRVDDEGELLQVDIGRQRGGPPGTVDREMRGVVQRMADGERIRVTPKMRGWMGLTRYKDPWAADPKPYGRLVVGETFFPLRKSTTRIVVPQREIFGPVWKRSAGQVTPRFAERFWKAFNRYTGQKGAKR